MKHSLAHVILILLVGVHPAHAASFLEDLTRLGIDLLKKETQQGSASVPPASPTSVPQADTGTAPAQAAMVNSPPTGTRPTLPTTALGRVKVATSPQLSLILAADGRVFGLGSNMYGQAGADPRKAGDYIIEPTLIDGLPPVLDVDVFSDGEASMVLGVDGRVYTWGRNETTGRLGQGKKFLRSRTAPESADDSRKIVYPPRSPLLSRLPPTVLDEKGYADYVAGLHQRLSAAIDPAVKRVVDEHRRTFNLTRAKDQSRAGLGAWIGKRPQTAPYMLSLLVQADLADGLAANNLASVLNMSGLPEKALPILRYWQKKHPDNAMLVNNMANAYLGDFDNAALYARKSVQSEDLHPEANKLLGLIHLKQGQKELAVTHFKRALAGVNDPEVAEQLRKLGKYTDVNRLLYDRHGDVPEFKLLQTTVQPKPAASLGEMEVVGTEVERLRQSIGLTLDAMAADKAKAPPSSIGRFTQQHLLTQAIMLESMRQHGQFKLLLDEARAELNQHDKLHAAETRGIFKRYDAKLATIEGGEGDEEEKLERLRVAQCQEYNAAHNKYLGSSAPVLALYVSSLEYITRRHHRLAANWGPLWADEYADFRRVQSSYLRDIRQILSLYPTMPADDCRLDRIEATAPTPALMIWEEQFCPSKLKIGLGPWSVAKSCYTLSIEGGTGAGIVGDVELKYDVHGEFQDFTFSLGVGTEWKTGIPDVLELAAGTSLKEFIKIGANPVDGSIEVLDWGVKAEATAAGGFDPLISELKGVMVGGEVKVVEVSLGVNSGITTEGVVPKVLDL